MKFTVIWQPTAQSELAELWMAAADREAVCRAADTIDSVLARAPREHGESREDDTRVLLVGPLGVEYEVNEMDRKVQVNAVWAKR